jgi:hypothetical protein
MSLNNLIPTVWSGMILAALMKSHVFASEGVISRDYEGEITGFGDSVKINSIGDVTVKDYTKNTDIDAAEVLDDASQILVIDQQKYFNFGIDDIDQAQQNPKVMAEATSRAAYALKDTLDTFLASLYTDIATANFIGSDGSPTVIDTAAKAYENLVDLGVLLDESDVPTDGRFVVVPPWYEGRMLKDERFVSFGTQGNADTLANGAIGRAAGFIVYKSNNISAASSKWKIIAGHKMGWNLAEQIVKVEGYRKERGFSDGLKGLHVYGAKVVRPTALACLIASKA